jgi:outer membrane receptor protein involved in Fe transport
MKKSSCFLIACLITFLFPLALMAQVTITGTVHNQSSGEAVPAVSVLVKGTNLGTYTDPDGNFSINVPRLPVVLIISHIGFDKQEITVSSANVLVKVEFVPVSTLGQEVVIAAQRTPQRILESPVTVERMSRKNLINLAAPNYYDAITNLKGVDMHTASLTFRTVTTRGFISSGNTRLNQLIDGMDNQAPGLNFSVGNVVGLTELDVDNIELLAGASSALYGSGGMTGTILITSKNPFQYQGLSYNVKMGMMHVDQRQREVSPYYDWSMRWAKNFNNKWAIKLAGQLLKANDWQAEDYRNKQQIGVLSKVVGGNRGNDPNFNGINIYGDETSANMVSFAQLVQNQTRAGILSATGNQVDVVSLLNTYYNAIGNPIYPSNAQVAGFYTFAPFGSTLLAILNNPAIKPNIDNMFPFYNGLKNNYFGNYSVSRTGYEEKYLVDYNTLNFKFTGGLHYKITPSTELSWNSYFGAGTTVYTGADRYSLRNLKIGQHKLELRAKHWFIRGYTTQENAGESYNATALGGFLNEFWKPSSVWFPQYIGTFSETRRQVGPNMADITIHQAARAAADVGRLLPGTPQFDAAVKKIRTTPIRNGGALFLDRSDLWSFDGQINLSKLFRFDETIDVIAGMAWKEWVMDSRGTIFADTAGRIKIHETGFFFQAKKQMFRDVLTISFSLRNDKQTNFKARSTPRVTAVVKAAKDNYIRLSYQSAYRFPTNQDQYISLVTGAGTLIGCLPEFQDYYKLRSTLPGYTPASILAYRASGNPANTHLLVQGTWRPVKPEVVHSFEIGYKGIINKDILIDAYMYHSRFKDFIARYALGQSRTGNPQELFSPFTTTNISFQQNVNEAVESWGWGIGIDYQLPARFTLYGNVYSDQLRDVPANFVSFFNAPKYRFNIGLRNENVYKNVGMNVVVKWQDNNYYEGTFVTGTLPYFAWVDAQVTYRPAGTKSVFRAGGTNLGNKYYRTGFGSPSVGGLYYVSYGYNIF